MATMEANAAKAFLARRELKQQITRLCGPEWTERIEAVNLEAPNEPDYVAAREIEVIAEALKTVNAETLQENETDLESLEGIGEKVADLLRENDYWTKDDLSKASDEDLLAIDGIGPNTLAVIREQVGSSSDETDDDAGEEDGEEGTDDGDSDGEGTEEAT